MQTASIAITKTRLQKRARVRHGARAGIDRAGGSFATVVETLIAKRSLSARQVAAGAWFYDLLNASHGCSGGTVGAYNMDRCDVFRQPAAAPSGWTQSAQDFQWLT